MAEWLHWALLVVLIWAEVVAKAVAQQQVKASSAGIYNSHGTSTCMSFWLSQGGGIMPAVGASSIASSPGKSCPSSLTNIPRGEEMAQHLFFWCCPLARQLPSPAQAHGTNVRELDVQELAHTLPSEHAALLAGAAGMRVATEEIGPSAGCGTACGGQQGKRAAPKGRPLDGEHEAGSASRWKAPARVYRLGKLPRRGGLAHGCA